MALALSSCGTKRLVKTEADQVSSVSREIEDSLLA
jgi:hypothetical protein